MVKTMYGCEFVGLKKDSEAQWLSWLSEGLLTQSTLHLKQKRRSLVEMTRTQFAKRVGAHRRLIRVECLDRHQVLAPYMQVWRRGKRTRDWNGGKHTPLS